MTTPAEKALFYFRKMCETFALDPNAPCNPELNYMMRAMKIAAAVDGDEYTLGESDINRSIARKHPLFVLANNDLLERLRGIV